MLEEYKLVNERKDVEKEQGVNSEDQATMSA